ncbi:hypothetical protein [Mailhella massiliensis]|uniref:Uncharacterized protein n=1 Tax=Mailhella massiliensis TaxID=1903261 RepID=A0A921AVE7_9BACT|nr:hypothetical protein [Mailhella massiliensis]HJD96646.1 hypothetical protein [Mailhella massiliensis]
MITNWPLVFFTVFSQLGAGVAFFSWWKDRRDAASSSRGRQFSAVSAALALIASLINFSGLASGAMLIAQAGCLILALASVGASRGCAPCGLAAWLAGACCVMAQAAAAVPGEVWSLSGMFPLVLFPLCTIILGASFSQLKQLGEAEDASVRYGRFYMPLRICLWIMLIITAIAPCMAWEDPFMRKSAIIWMQTQLYWMGVIFSGVVLGLSHMGRITLPVQAIVAFVSIFGLRTAFYADGVHGIIDMSTLYMR